MRYIPCMLILSVLCLAEDTSQASKEVKEEPKTDVKSEVKAEAKNLWEVKTYIKENSSDEKEAKWKKLWDTRVQDFTRDSDTTDENSYLNSTILDWLFERRSYKVEDFTKEDRLLICRWYVLYIENDYEPPCKLKEFLSPAYIKMLIDLFKSNPPKD